MKYVLDTNVISELMRPVPDAGLLDWLDACDWDQVFVTAFTCAEVFYGVAVMPDGRRKSVLASRATKMFEEEFDGRILVFDQRSATVYAELAARRRAAGRPIKPFDAGIAAIARARGMTVATRNVTDFEHTGVGIINPWTAP